MAIVYKCLNHTIDLNKLEEVDVWCWYANKFLPVEALHPFTFCVEYRAFQNDSKAHNLGQPNKKCIMASTEAFGVTLMEGAHKFWVEAYRTEQLPKNINKKLAYIDFEKWQKNTKENPSGIDLVKTDLSVTLTPANSSTSTSSRMVDS